MSAQLVAPLAAYLAMACIVFGVIASDGPTKPPLATASDFGFAILAAVLWPVTLLVSIGLYIGRA